MMCPTGISPHAAAYVMMAWRIGYCKIHYPLAYYGAFFSIRAKAFSYELMCQGQAHLEAVMADYKRRMDAAANKEAGAQPLTNREELAYNDMRVVQEMYARGYEFTPIDIFTAQSRSFQIVGDKLMPSINSIEGLGEKVADAIVEAAKDQGLQAGHRYDGFPEPAGESAGDEPAESVRLLGEGGSDAEKAAENDGKTLKFLLTNHNMLCIINQCVKLMFTVYCA